MTEMLLKLLGRLTEVVRLSRVLYDKMAGR